VNFAQRTEYLADWRAIGLIVSAVNISNRPTLIDDHSCRVCNAESIMPKCVIEAIIFLHLAIIIQQERKRNWMPAEKLRGPPNAVPFFSGNICKAGAKSADLFFVGLKLSHALAAVRSPGSTKKFDNGGAARD
jgi:hypothetical protein